MAGEDPHATSAALVLGHCNTDKERQIGKTLNFSIMYAGGVPTILRQMARADIPCDRPQAKAWLAELHRQMPGLKVINEMITDEVRDKGYIYDIFGRRYHPDPRIPYNDALRKLLNALIQGCAAGLTRKAIVNISNGLRERDMQAHQVNIVHDEIILDCLGDELDVLNELVPGWMGNELLEKVLPITTEMSTSFTNWADKE